jgi:large subunit ribosomal protein L32
MAMPKKQMTRTRSGGRRSQIRLRTKALTTCPSCHSAIVAHRVCTNCGMYRGRVVLKKK